MCGGKPGSCEAITIIQPELVNNNTRCTVLLSAGMCHTTAFNSVSTERAAFSTVSQGFKVGTKQLGALKLRAPNFNGAIVQLYDRGMGSVFSDTSPKLYFSLCFDSYCMFIRGVIFL